MRQANGIVLRVARRRCPGCSAALGLITLVTIPACLETAAILPQVDTRSGFVADAQAQAYSDDFWGAIADLDLASTLLSAKSDEQTRFAAAFAAFAAGQHEKAERDFALLSAQRTDLSVAVAAHAMLATALLYQHKWTELRDLPGDSLRQLEGGTDIFGLARWGRAFADQGAQSMTFPVTQVRLPLQITAVGTPAIRVKVNGKDYDFWLDTGSSLSVVSSEVARQTGITTLSADTLLVGTFAGTAPVRAAAVRKLQIGPILLSNAPAVVMDASLMHVNTTEGTTSRRINVDGILGWDVIRQFDISLDYTEGIITFREPRILRTTGTKSQNLTWVGRPLVEVRSRVGGTLHFTLDTGAQGSFVNTSILKRIKASAVNSSTRAYGIARTGGNNARVVRSLTLHIGGSVLPMKELIVYEANSSGLVNSDGILGSDIGRFGTIRIDATNGLFSVGAE